MHLVKLAKKDVLEPQARHTGTFPHDGRKERKDACVVMLLLCPTSQPIPAGPFLLDTNECIRHSENRVDR